MKRQRYTSPQKGVADTIRSAYSRLSGMTLRPRPPGCLRSMTATTVPKALGDCLMLTDLPFIAKQHDSTVHVWNGSPHFIEVMKFHPSYCYTSAECGAINPFLVDILRLRELYDLGNGHQLQQFRRAWGFPVDLKPKPVLVNKEVRQPNRVILHFEAGKHNAIWQRLHWHPRMRILYPESKAELEKFIKSRSDLEFIQVGQVDMGIYGSTWVPTLGTVELIKLIQTGSWFIGILSGPLHVATASDLRCIGIVNYPEVHKIVLPCLKYSGTPEEEWMYPQHMYLHQEGESTLVPKMSKMSLEAAFNLDIYPFGQDTWLDLINEI